MKRVFAIAMTFILLVAMVVCAEGLALKASASQLEIAFDEMLVATEAAEIEEWEETEETYEVFDYHVTPMETVEAEIIINEGVIAAEDFQENWNTIYGESEVSASRSGVGISFGILAIVLLLLCGAVLLVAVLAAVIGVVLLIRKRPKGL